MKCLNCRTAIRFEPDGESWVYVTDAEKKLGFTVAYGLCPECSHLLILRREGRYWEPDDGSEPTALMAPTEQSFIFPSAPARFIEAPEIPDIYRQTFNEASAVLQISPKASAAISRRLLQDILRSHFGITRPNLSLEIEEFIRTCNAPPYLIEAIDTIRQIGNFAAHPSKDQMTGSVVDVEPGEAEWALDTLEAFLDFAFIQPALLARRKASLDKKLSAIRRGPST